MGISLSIDLRRLDSLPEKDAVQNSGTLGPGMAVERSLTVANGVAPVELVPVRAGEFIMGTENAQFSEAPPHRVLIGMDFLIGRYPITQAQWRGLMGNNSSAFQGSPHSPIDSVSWDQAATFCDRLSAQCGHLVRLPSETEWEYACRAGTSGEYFFGEWGSFGDPNDVPGGAREALCKYAWFDINSGESTRPVGLKLPNAWGLHDMIGNVWEWCADVWHGDYNAAPDDERPWLEGAARQPRRCLRGGAWDMDAFHCRSSYRSFDHRDLATSRFGFRIVSQH